MVRNLKTSEIINKILLKEIISRIDPNLREYLRFTIKILVYEEVCEIIKPHKSMIYGVFSGERGKINPPFLLFQNFVFQPFTFF